TGIGPETFAFISSDSNFTGSSISAEQLAFYSEHGYCITGSDCIDRPEVLESNFHAYHATGDQKHLDHAASAINSFNKFLKTSTGFVGINGINDPNMSKIDDTLSFWFAEVLKYLYLTFNGPNHTSLD
ncbi:glycoside hydrolase, partial [Gymnopilus junonius]